MLSIFKNTWGLTSSYCTHTKPLVCVDTDNGRIVLSFQVICNMNGRLESESNIVVNKLAFILLVNKAKKVARWRAVWDTNDKGLLEASAKLYHKLGIEVPTPKAHDNPITLEEAEALADNFLRLSMVGFPKNNHADLMKHMVKLCRFEYTLCHMRFLLSSTNLYYLQPKVADRLSWDWSDGNKVPYALKSFPLFPLYHVTEKASSSYCCLYLTHNIRARELLMNTSISLQMAGQ